MEMYACEIMLDAQFVDYIREKLYKNNDQAYVVDRTFLRNCMWRNNELMRLRALADKYKAVIEGAKIKEEMGL